MLESIYTEPNNTIEKVKNLIDEFIESCLKSEKIENFSDKIARKLNTDYLSLNILFLTIQEISLDTFITLRIVEKVKELLVYTDKSLKEISIALGYHNSTELAKQLKKHTGFLPSHYKQIKRNKQKLIIARSTFKTSNKKNK